MLSYQHLHLCRNFFPFLVSVFIPPLAGSPIRIEVFWALWSHGDKIKVAELRDPQDLAAEPPDSIQTLSAQSGPENIRFQAVSKCF